MIPTLARWLLLAFALLLVVVSAVARRRPCDRAIVACVQIAMTTLAATLLALLGLAPSRVLEYPELLSPLRLVALAATLWLVKELVDAFRRLVGALREQSPSPHT